MSKLQIITDSAKLSATVKRALAQYATVGANLHVAAVSALWHVCKHGNPAVLNTIHAGLRSNDQTALKMYIRRAQIINGLGGGVPDGLPASEIQAAHSRGMVLDFRQGQFVVFRGHTSEEAKSLAKLCEDRFISPDGEVDRMLLERNNFAEVQTLGDVDVLKRIVQVAKVLEGETETRKLAVSDKVKSTIKAWGEQAAIMLKQYEATGTTTAAQPTAH